jgi:hypothetical protein
VLLANYNRSYLVNNIFQSIYRKFYGTERENTLPPKALIKTHSKEIKIRNLIHDEAFSR